MAVAAAALDGAGQRWLLLRDPADPCSEGDADLLVGDAERAEHVLRASGFVPVRARGHGSHRFLIGYDATAGRWTRLDLVSRLDFGPCQELRTELAEPVLDRRVVVDGIPRPSGDDAFWLLALQLALRSKPVSAARRAELTRLAAEVTEPAGPVGRAVHARFGAGRAAALARAAGSGEAAAADAALGLLGRAWRQADRATARAARRLVARALRRVPVRATAGLTLAVIGPDGAGKTTLLDALTATLPVPSRYVYMGVWRTGEAEAWARHVPGARLLLRLLRLLRSSAGAALGRARGEVVLLDRFTLDAALPSDDLDWRGRISAVLVERVARAPDRIVLLDGPPEEMFRRKGEHGVEELRRRRAAYLDMRARFPQMVVVDATQPAEAVRDEVTAIAWRDLARGRRGRR